MQLMKVGKGNREFAMLMFKYPNGHIEFYTNEITAGGQFEAIDNDEEFEEVTLFIDLALNKIKPEGSDL